MDLIEPTINSAAAGQRAQVAADVALQAQVYLHKQIQQLAENSLNTLLASVSLPPTGATGDAPLATSGTLGTQVNTYV